ncbi:hypothetical protein DSO57_1026718 [Entomophthora muscae]|uniref:Uncharacterized protein n=1 Tax=Entomophthora muscae TaxID=34485 RepID=A0ACC2TDL4_9FUNG|nr:hypothetical protein DSO57_1026718 [Entomophthora muscae]
MLTFNVNKANGSRAESIKQHLIEDSADVIGLQEISKICKTWQMLPGWKVKVSKHCSLILTNPKLQFVATKTLFGGQVIKAEISYDNQMTFTALCIYATANSKDNINFWRKLGSLKMTGVILFVIYGANKDPRLGSADFVSCLEKLNLQDALDREVNSFENMTYTIWYLTLEGFAGSRLDYFLVSIEVSEYFLQLTPPPDLPGGA